MRGAGGEGFGSPATVKVLDLGLALLAGESNAAGRELTTTGQMMGTLDYMAPEQGSSSHTVDIRADIYSLGATLYKLLTGQAPFGGEKYVTPVQKMMALATETPPSVESLRPEVPPALAAIVTKMLSRDPSSRFSVPAEVAEALHPFAQENHVSLLLLDPESRTQETTAPRTSTTEKHVANPMTESRPSFQDGQVPTLPTIPAVSRKDSTPAQRPLPARLGKTANLKTAYLAAAAVGLLLLASGGVYYGITILIKNKEGKVIGKVEVEDGTTAEIQQDGKKIAEVDASQPGKVSVTPVPPSKEPGKTGEPAKPVVPINITPDKLPQLADNAPISLHALAQRPAKIEGLQSWTAELTGPKGLVVAVAFSPKENLLAAASSDGNVRLIDPSSGKVSSILMGNPSPFSLNTAGECQSSLAFSPAGDFLAKAGTDGSVRIWTVATGKVVRVLTRKPGEPSGRVFALCWSPDGKRIAAAGVYPLVVWSLESGEIVLEVSPEGAGYGLVSCAWSPRGDIIVGAPFSGAKTPLLFLDAGTGKKLGSVTIESTPYVLEWSPDGSKVAFSGGKDSCVLDVATKKFLKSPAALAFRWSRDSQSLLAVTTKESDFSIREVHKIQIESGHSKRLFGMGVPGSASHAFSTDGKTIAAGMAGEIRLCDGETGELLQTIDGTQGFHWGSSLSFSEDGTVVSQTATAEGLTAIWSLDKPAPPRIFAPFGGNYPTGVISPKGKLLAVAGHAGMGVYDCTTEGRFYEDANGNAGQGNLRWDRAGTRAAWLSQRKILVWNTVSKKIERELVRANSATIYGIVAWSPTGKFLSSWEVDGEKVSFHVFNVNEGKYLKTLPLTAYSTNAIWQDDTHLAVGNGGAVNIWNVQTGKVEYTQIVGDAVEVRPLAWLPDGGLVVQADAKQIIVFNKARRRVRSINTPGWMTVAPNLSRAAYDGPAAMYLWDLKTGQPTGTFVRLPNDHGLIVSAAGHYAGSEGVEEMLSYVVQTAEGQQTLTPAEFTAKYGWKNDPSQVKLE